MATITPTQGLNTGVTPLTFASIAAGAVALTYSGAGVATTQYIALSL